MCVLFVIFCFPKYSNFSVVEFTVDKTKMEIFSQRNKRKKLRAINVLSATS